MASPESSPVSVVQFLRGVQHQLISFEQAAEDRALDYLTHRNNLTELLSRLLNRPSERMLNREDIDVVDMVVRVRYTLELAVIVNLGASVEVQVAHEASAAGECLQASMRRRMATEIEATQTSLVRVVDAWIRKSLWPDNAISVGCDFQECRHDLEQHILVFTTVWVDLQHSLQRGKPESPLPLPLRLPGSGRLHPACESEELVHDASETPTALATPASTPHRKKNWSDRSTTDATVSLGNTSTTLS